VPVTPALPFIPKWAQFHVNKNWNTGQKIKPFLRRSQVAKAAFIEQFYFYH
jgi:hypothetical protein